MWKSAKASFVAAFVLLVCGAGVPAANVNLKITATQPGVSGAVCVRAIIKKSDGSFVPGEWDNDSGYPVLMRGKAMAPNTIIQVPTGQTEIIIGKGLDYLPQTIVRNFDVPGQTYTVNVTLQPVFDLVRKGWRGGDAHVHYNHGENQIRRTPEEAFALLAAGGMNFASFCEEHYGATTLTRAQMLDVWKKYDSSECKLWLGVEEPKNAWGHHVAILDDPWAIRSDLPYHWGIKTVHEQGGVSYPVHPQRHFPGRFYDDPNAGRQWALYPDNNHLKSYPLDALLGYLDGWSGVSDAAHAPATLDPYFKLLSMGYRIPLLADSDVTMDRVRNEIKSPGCWMTYYKTDGPATRASIASAMKNGRVLSTTGPLVFFTIDGAMSGETLAPNGSARTVRIKASHTFNPWTFANSTFNGSETCKISQIDLFRNGQVVQTWNPNTPTADLEYTINESSPNSYYMVRVLGNENQWMAAYASPIYFDGSARPRQPAVYKSLINGKVYDASSGQGLSASVSCVRYGTTEWTIQTDARGLFRAYVPLDAELVAKDSSGRELRQDIMKHEPAYAFCHNLGDNFSENMGASVDAYKNIVQEMTWEFPMGYQPAASYVKASLPGNAAMSGFSINSAPAPTSGKRNTEIVMLIVDKTRVKIGDTVNYAVIYRQPQGQTPSEELSVEWKGWDPNYPRIYTRFGKNFQYNNVAAGLINLGGGFYVRQGSVVVPSWVANASETTGAIKLFATARGSSGSEEAILLLPLGPTKKELLVSTTWDGFPASWGEAGVGPCSFHRELSMEVRYADYRAMSVSLNLNGSPITLQPSADTAHVADADDAVFDENFYYDGQCEPQYRNIPFRDGNRGQPAAPDFSSVPIQTPSGGGGGGGGGGANTALLTIQINGGGAVSPNLNGQNLTVGRNYKLTAKPQAGQIFSNWSGDLSSSNATLTFAMQAAMSVQANFVPNPFLPAKGIYAGLFLEEAAARHESSGFFTINLTERGTFSGRFIIGGNKFSTRGQFNAGGDATLQMGFRGTNITVALHLDVATSKLSGQLSDGIWTSQLTGNKTGFGSTNPATDFAGRYTMIFPGSDSESIPAGDGFGLVTMNSSGKLRWVGAVADGSTISQSVPISASGEWPLFVSLYRGKGSLLGWASFTNGLSSTIHWIRPPMPEQKFYPAGFTNVISVGGSRYNSSTNPILNFQNGILGFAGGNLESYETPLQFGTDNRFATTNGLSMRLNISAGSFSGRFVHPVTGKPIPFRGALLQNQNSSSGFFLGTNQSGSVRLRASE
ncbi:MAG: CehA/McbA family metallohydrolase [Verrucomicrobiota bacterium]